MSLCSMLPTILSLHAQEFTKQDTLRGSIGPGRDWWNLLHYNLWVKVDIQNKSISGKNNILFERKKQGVSMQIDLQQPMKIDSAFYRGTKVVAKYKDSVYYFELINQDAGSALDSLLIFYSGKPKEALNPPWDGGWIWSNDDENNPFISVACQNLGASVWFPCKDHQSDKPDQGVRLHITVPNNLTAVGNGKLINSKDEPDFFKTWTWEVLSPISNYNIVPYIGNYTLIEEQYKGLAGDLSCSYYVLKQDTAKASIQFKQVPLMLNCFEKWFGKYPFYVDGYKLVQAPHLGMEHQSAIAYGNGFMNGYKGTDLSGSGHGLKWDFIIIHESGHEWFGNNITSNDCADMWVHEAFTNYAETIFTECCCGIDAAKEYVIGIRKKIKNDSPITGAYGVNREGSVDMYYKGGNLIHLIRMMINDDEIFRNMLAKMNSQFRHQTVNGEQIEKFIISYTSLPLQKIFDQYLRSTNPPTLVYRKKNNQVYFWWEDCVPDFSMKIKLASGLLVEPGLSKMKPQKIKLKNLENFEVSKDYYLQIREQE